MTAPARPVTRRTRDRRGWVDLRDPSAYRGPVVPASRLRLLVATFVAVLWLVPAQSVLGHEESTAGGYTLVVGLIGEPFFQGPRSGFDFTISQAGRPVDGAEQTLLADVSGGGLARALTILAREEAGHYEAVFDPPAEASYQLHLGGTIEGKPINETFAFHLLPRDPATGGSPVEPVPASAPAGGLPLLPIAAIGGLLVIGLGFALVIAGRPATTA